jgi:hypothetical protein
VALADCCRMCIYLHYGELPCHILQAGRYRGADKERNEQEARRSAWHTLATANAIGKRRHGELMRGLHRRTCPALRAALPRSQARRRPSAALQDLPSTKEMGGAFRGAS